MPEQATDTQDRGLRTRELCRQFLAIARKKLTGTLVVFSSEDEVKSFLCRNGAIADIDNGREHSLLTEVLIDSSSVSSRQLKKAERLAEKNEDTLAAALIEMNLVPEDELLEAIEEGITNEVTETFSWDIEQSSFHSHEIDETLDGFTSDLADYFDLLADPETLFLEAMHRLDRWDLVREYVDLLLDVYYATPGTFGYFREPEVFSAEIRILGAIDGTKDVEEVIYESGVDPFEAIEVIRGLIRDGAIELINPVQMFQLGTQAEAAGNMEKACRLFRRARERGLNDFDIELRLASALENLGCKKEAAASYYEYSEKCLNQLRVDDAIRALRRVVKLNSDQDETMFKLLDLLIQHNRAEEAVETGLKFASRLEGKDDPQTALAIVLRLRSTNVRDVRLHEKIIHLASKCGNHDLVREEKETIARVFHNRRDTAEALESFQKLYCEGDDSLEVRLKLVKLHKEQGNRHKAIEHINSVLSSSGRYPVKDAKTLLELHRIMRDLQPTNPRSNRWLVQHHLKNGEKEKAVELLKAWLPELEKVDDGEEMIGALEELIALEDRLQYRWTLTSVLEKAGKKEESREQLRDLAHHAMRNREFDQAAKALEHILKSVPLDTETRKAQVELYDLRGEKRLAAEKLQELATLEIIAGNIQDAEIHCRRFLIMQPDEAEVVDKFGKLCLELGDKRKAVEQFLKAAKTHLDNRNFGLARRTLDRLLKASPQHREGKTMLSRLEEAEAALSRPASAREPASAAPSTTTGTPATPTPEKQPFESPTPVKTTVSGITARLRSLKSGQASTSRERQTSVAVGDIAARLKSLKVGGSEGGKESTERQKGQTTKVTPVPSLKKALAASAAALQSAGGDNPAAVEPSSEETAPAATGAASAEAPDPPPRALKSAAARLKALSSRKKALAAGAEASPATTAGPEDEVEPAADNALPAATEETAPPPASAPVPAEAVPAMVEPPPRSEAAAPAESAPAESDPAPSGPGDDGSEPHPSPAPEAETRAEDDAAAATSPASPKTPGEAPGNAPTAARLQRKLGSSASRLAALRKSGA